MLEPLNAYVCHAFSSLEKRLRNFEKAQEILQDVVRKKPTATICISLAELQRQVGWFLLCLYGYMFICIQFNSSVLIWI